MKLEFIKIISTVDVVLIMFFFRLSIWRAVTTFTSAKASGV